MPQPAGGARADHGRARTLSREQDPATGSTADPNDIDRAPAARWWRRRQPRVVAGVAIAILALNVAVTASISQLLADPSPRIPAAKPTATATAETLPVTSGQESGLYEPAPDHVLALVSDGAAADQPADPGDKLGALGISPGGLKRYENLYGPDLWGYVTVWSGESRYGLSCLLLSASGQPISDGGRAAEGCSLKGSDAIADISGSDSLIRFVLKDDHIDVYMYEGGADPNASQD